jgi:hypothetical protein
MTRAHSAVWFLAGLLYVCSAAQPAPLVLGEVREMVNNIDANLKALNKSRATLQTGTDRGGELTIYRKDSNVVRIDAIIGGSNSDLQNVFYYSGASPTFVRTKTVTYPYSSTSNAFDFTRPRVTAAAEYYVRDGELIPADHARISPPAASSLLAQAELLVVAVRHGNQVIDIERLLKKRSRDGNNGE